MIKQAIKKVSWTVKIIVTTIIEAVKGENENLTNKVSDLKRVVEKFTDGKENRKYVREAKKRLQ